MADSDPARIVADRLALHLEWLVNAHLLEAQQQLPPSDIAFILLKITADLARGGMLLALQTKREDRTAEQILDFWQESLNKWIASARPQILAKFAELTAGNGNGG